MHPRNHALIRRVENGDLHYDDDYRSLVDELERALTEIEPGALVRALANVEPCAVTGTITIDGIMEALGESADVWPKAIRDHGETAKVIQFPRP